MPRTPDITATNPATPGYVRVTGGSKSGPVAGNVIQVVVGGKLLPVTEAVITMRPSEFVTIQLTTHPEFIDVEALEKNTDIKIVKE